jgi:hypothetical protein
VDACPTLVSPTLPPNTVGCTPTNDCTHCGGPACGAKHYAYTCGGAAVGGVYAPPDIDGCARDEGSANGYCCPVAACVRYSGADAACSSVTGLAVGRYCHPEATLPPGCVAYPFANSMACCPS